MNPGLVAFNKPFGVVCQFSAHERHPTLGNFLNIPDIYAAGRLDTDSEGLLLLTADGALQHAIADPKAKLPKVYCAQVEGIPTEDALNRMRNGLDLGDFTTRPCKVRQIDEPGALWPRNPPIRFRKSIPTTWLEIEITEGKNRQVRRMTARVGLPTLRLVRIAIGPYRVDGLAPGTWREVDASMLPSPPRRGRKSDVEIPAGRQRPGTEPSRRR